MAIEDIDLQDFEQVVTECRFVPGEFTLTETGEHRSPGESLLKFIATVTVTHRQRHISRGYSAGDNGTAWVVDFARDLHAGVFGRHT
jgi:hypothetical protein